MYSLKYFVTTVKDGPVDPEQKSPLDAVLVNREMVFTNHDVKSYVRMKSPHGEDEILEITKENRARWEDKLTDGPVADALITRLPDMALEYDPGDRPVYLVFHPKYRVLALVPAGEWGTVNKILVKVAKKCAFICHIPLEEFVIDLEIVQSSSSNYEMEVFQVFGEDVDEWKGFISGEYLVQDCETKGCKKFVAHGSIVVDFDGYNSHQLSLIGVRAENIKPPNVDTSPDSQEAQASRFMVMSWMNTAEANVD